MASAAIPGGALIDGSGTTGVGVSEEVFTKNRSRQYLLIQNVGAGDLWINFGVAAVQSQPSIKIVPDASAEWSAAGTGVVPTDTVNVIAAAAQDFVAKQSH